MGLKKIKDIELLFNLKDDANILITQKEIVDGELDEVLRRLPVELLHTGSVVYVSNTLPGLESGNDYTDYYIKENDSYVHYRFIDNNYVIVGSNSSECGLTNADNDSVDFAIADENGNAILAVQNGHIKTRNFNSYKPDKTEVKILFIGNSLTQDAVCYLPLLLDEITPDVKYTIYDWYNAGMNLSQQYNCFINNTNCRTFGTITNNQNGGWNVKDNSVNMKWVCDNCDFDIVVIQEYSYYSYTDDVEVSNFNNIIDYLKTNYHKTFKVFSFVDAPMRTRTDDYIKAKNYAQLHFKNTMCEGIVNPGTAVVYALENDVLKNLGDNGGLTPDGTHTQEGLPCMLQSYVLALWLFSLLGIPKSIYNSQARMTQEFYNNWQTIGSNLGSGVVEGTDEEYLEAQKVAIKAYKFGKKLQLDIINEMTEV